MAPLGKHTLTHRWALPQKKSPGGATQHRRGKPYSMQPLPRVNPGSPHSPSSYTTLPAQMVHFTFP